MKSMSAETTTGQSIYPPVSKNIAHFYISYPNFYNKMVFKYIII